MSDDLETRLARERFDKALNLVRDGEISDLRSENARLRRALRPFVNKLHELEEDADYPHPRRWGKTVECNMKVSDLRYAARALEGEVK